MSVDAKRLSQVVQLFSVDIGKEHDVATLADLLGESEEVLPWLALKVDAFATDQKMDQALREAAGRTSSAATLRSSAPVAHFEVHKVARNFDEALGQLVRESAAHQKLALDVDALRTEMIGLSAAESQFEPQNRVLLGPEELKKR